MLCNFSVAYNLASSYQLQEFTITATIKLGDTSKQLELVYQKYTTSKATIKLTFVIFTKTNLSKYVCSSLIIIIVNVSESRPMES